MVALGLVVLAAGSGVAEPGAPLGRKDLGGLYDRIAADLAAGLPLVATVYVALCDAEWQGIIPPRDLRVCVGDAPDSNLYWASGGGLEGHLPRVGFRRVLRETPATGPVLVRAVWRGSLPSGGALWARGVRGPVETYVVGLAYRGRDIETGVADFMEAAGRDESLSIVLSDGRVLAAGGRSHLIGYVGHDHFMDMEDGPAQRLRQRAAGDGILVKGAFALACISDRFFRPALERPNLRILLLNRQLTFPSAVTVAATVRAVARGFDSRGVRREAGLAFAKAQGLAPDRMGGVFAGGD
jgi:hypothetical protein